MVSHRINGTNSKYISSQHNPSSFPCITSPSLNNSRNNPAETSALAEWCKKYALNASSATAPTTALNLAHRHEYFRKQESVPSCTWASHPHSWVSTEILTNSCEPRWLSTIPVTRILGPWPKLAVMYKQQFTRVRPSSRDVTNLVCWSAAAYRSHWLVNFRWNTTFAVRAIPLFQLNTFTPHYPYHFVFWVSSKTFLKHINISFLSLSVKQHELVVESVWKTR